MFTLRFRTDNRDLVVSAGSYQIDQHQGFAFVILTGAEYHVGGPQHPSNPPWDVCFVTNEAGKTIDRIGPFKVPA